MLKRRKTRLIRIGDMPVGGGTPVSIQSMTSTPTKDIKSTLDEIKRLAIAGCDIVRVGVPDMESAVAIRDIKRESPLPVVADIHFDYKLALESIKSGADGLRINPGNIKKAEYIRDIADACKDLCIPIRVGVNSGSLDKSLSDNKPVAVAMVESALGHIQILEELDFFDIKVSLKSSDVNVMIEANRLFAETRDYPIHLGVTEAGVDTQAIVKNSIGIGVLLSEGIGDTLRVSITGDPVIEVEVGKLILRTLGLRREGVEIISCPTCARKEFDVESVVREFDKMSRNVKDYVKVAIMGCVVNGPGEAREADFGVAVGKNGAVLFRKGEVVKKITKDDILKVLLEELSVYNK